ncbi:hypothetical protein QMK19_10285 [Streptomyces sp. H10-C2]|uniref:imidazolonepropionase-like domain-containing protein n=1 Tax=unclassified Streptomyces TaxID=2593676 RepID=UPI0024BAAC0F|nr:MULTISPECIES: hypothetical protein [unclassified Streptomyces]MDJ0341978.1 hypothetical protein [Streptomyces sp. PH10-H1]MDJ0369951.1 hypothetical protein [Streptomyces sp. H10-C2]MDJ0370048.1 hypothetical protein [Streptomyces sp. H10-C2]
MLTIHASDSGERAVAVSGDRIVAVGTLGELRAAHPLARVRAWRGTVGPGLVHAAPVPDAPSPRERIHALLRFGATAVVDGYLTDPGLRAAAARGGLARVPAGSVPPALVPGGRADLAVFDADGVCVATVLGGRLVHRRA